jgi:hypothetical protein
MFMWRCIVNSKPLPITNRSLKKDSIPNDFEPYNRLNLVHDRQMKRIMNINDLNTIEHIFGVA